MDGKNAGPIQVTCTFDTNNSIHDRNEQFQEELWKRSFEFLKDHLSPESVEKYSLPPSLPPSNAPTVTTGKSSTQVQNQEPQDGGASEGNVATGESEAAVTASAATGGSLSEKGVDLAE